MISPMQLKRPVVTRRRLFLLGGVAIVLAAVVVFWPWIDAQRRVVIVLSTTLQTPVLTWAVEALTAEPEVDETTVSGMPTSVVRPGRDSRWPAVVFVNGATERGRFHPDVQRLARGLARAGFLVLVPDPPGLADGEITPSTARAITAAALEAIRRTDVKDGRVGLLGVSVGASLALLAAEDPRLAPHVSAVVGVAPYADLPNVIRLATTGSSLEGQRLEPFQADPFLGLVVARSMVAALPAGGDRDSLLSLLSGVDDDSSEPLASLGTLSTRGLRPDVAAVLHLLQNNRPSRFERLYAALPAGLRAGLERLSPLRGAARLQAPVELVSAWKDKFFPVAESHALERAAPDVDVTVTGAAGEHVIPQPSLTDPVGLFRFDGFAVRSLKELHG
jgi:pimeloyl-ACP methyl ester carboxylesterase